MLGLRLLRGRTLSGVVAGVPNIMLTTTGARTGRSRTVPLIGLPLDGGGTAIVGTRWGSEHNPGWFYVGFAKYRRRISRRAVPIFVLDEVSEVSEASPPTG